MPQRTVLIAGASIAGPTLAYWLHRHGMTPIVVERAPSLRGGGQTVDLRGTGRTVAQRMGLEEAVRERTTRERGIRFVDGGGRVRAAFTADAFGGQGPVIDLEILRGELAALLYDRSRQVAEYVFGDEITGLVDHGDRVEVSFAHGADRTVDLVVAADGLRSRTRDLAFGDAAQIRPLGLCTAYFTIPRRPSDDSWARWHNAPGGLVAALRPDNLGTTRALLSFLTRTTRGHHRLPAGRQQWLLRRLFADVGWEVPRVLADMPRSPDFYFESLAQVHMPRWSRGRVAVVGDAGYCASPISGMGTTLALTGAYILAGELARHTDHRAAFEAYEARMRPYVNKAQNLPPGVPRIASPRSRLGVQVLNTVLHTVSRPTVGRVLGRFLSPAADDSLPDYPPARP